jgi:hypothetical protein
MNALFMPLRDGKKGSVLDAVPNFGKFLALQIIQPFKAGQEFGEKVFIRNNICV